MDLNENCSAWQRRLCDSGSACLKSKRKKKILSTKILGHLREVTSGFPVALLLLSEEARKGNNIGADASISSDFTITIGLPIRFHAGLLFRETENVKQSKRAEFHREAQA